MPATAKEIQDRLTPNHLIPPETPAITSDAEMKEQVVAASVPETPKVDPDAPDLRGEKQYTFPIEYRDGRGKVWKGEFTSKILTIHERSQSGSLRAMLGAGQPSNSFDSMTSELNYMVSHMTYSLIEKPDWAENLRALEDPGIIQAIFEEVDSHESFFLGWEAPQSTSKEKSG